MAAYQSAASMPFISNGDRSRISFLSDNRTHLSDSYRIWKCGKMIYLLQGALTRKANSDNSSNGFRCIQMDRLYECPVIAEQKTS
jgi:hypothetical protein